ncbi:MAG: helix-turn-helix domain-containing protein [Candidatus Bathyarchaeota archaeon]
MSKPLDEPYHVVMEIENKQCKGLRMLENAGVQQYTLVDVRGVPHEPTRHLIRMPSNEFSNLPEELFAEPHIDTSGNITSAWFNSDGCDICSTILANGSFLISMRHVKEFIVVYSFVAPDSTAYERIITTLKAKNAKFTILEIGKFKPRSKTLTEKQERVLWLALKMGFFEYPRKVTMLQLSKRLGTGLSSLSEILRRGLRRLLEDHF